MFCTNCGSKVNSGEKFCPNCGAKVENGTNAQIVSQPVQETITNSESTIKEQSTSAVQPVVNNQISTMQQSTVSSIPTNDPNNSFENFSQYLEQGQGVNTTEKQKDGIGTASLVIGILAVIFSLIFNVLVVPLAIVGLIFGFISKKKGAKKIVAIILNFLGIIIPIVILVFVVLVLNITNTDIATNTFYGDGYTLTYDYNWEEVTLSTDQQALEYKGQASYLAPIGKSAVSDYPCDFEKTSCQTSLYNEFHKYWNNSLEDNSLYLYKDSYGFSVLKDDLYIATYDYGKTTNELRGKYYLIVSKEKNVVLSFMTNTATENTKELNEEVLKLLEEIDVESNASEDSSTGTTPKDSDTNVIYDDDLYNTLDSLSNWNRYSNLRSGQLGKLTTVNGGWRILGTSEEYWKIENGNFWWYQSVNNQNDNYWYGTTKIIKGKEGLAQAGLDESKVDSIITQSKGQVTSNDINTIIFTPTKIISGGVDKSATNIPAGTTWTYVWIIVDHGSEGIEAQVLNMQTSSTSYYVKLAD